MGTAKTEQGGQLTASVKSGQNGFTIVETLIVLAVTGILFVSAIMLVSGRQNKTEFSQAINNIKTQIDQTINEVSSGYYPNNANFNCKNNSGTISISTPPVGVPANPQGGNEGCIFVGKIIHFSTTADPEPFYVYSLAGAQTDTSGSITTTLKQAAPQLVTQSTATNYLQYGLTTKWVRIGGVLPDIGSFGFVNSLGAYSGTSGDLLSGSSQVSLLPIAGGSVADSDATAQTAINNYFTSTLNPDSDLNPAAGIQICFDSGGTNQHAIVSIGGGSGRVLGTTLQIYNGACS